MEFLNKLSWTAVSCNLCLTRKCSWSSLLCSQQSSLSHPAFDGLKQPQVIEQLRWSCCLLGNLLKGICGCEPVTFGHSLLYLPECYEAVWLERLQGTFCASLNDCPPVDHSAFNFMLTLFILSISWMDSNGVVCPPGLRAILQLAKWTWK